MISNRKTWILGLIVLCVAVSGGITATGQVVPETQSQEGTPGPRPLTDDERSKLGMRAFEQLQKVLEAQKQQGATPAAAPTPTLVQRPPLADGQVQLSYDNADLYDFINQIADALGITPIIIDPEVKGSVTIHSSAPMSRDDVFPLFNVILKNNNVALIKQGNIYQIVPTSAALKRGLEIVEHLPPASQEKPPSEKEPEKKPAPAPNVPASGPQAPGKTPPVAAVGSQAPAPAAAVPPSAPAAAAQVKQPESSKAPRLATHVLRVEFVPVKDLIEPLKLFMTEGGVIMPYERLNMLIVTDYGDSIAKIVEIIRLLDDGYMNPDYIELVKIKNNASADLLEDLKKIFGSGAKDAQTGVYFVSLDRINALLVITSSKRALQEVKRWIAELDATSARSVQTFVYTVENSTASNIAMILSALFGGEGGGAVTGGAAGAAGPFGTGRTSGAAPTQTAPTGAGPFGSSAGTSGGGFGGQGASGGSMFGGGTFFGGQQQQLGPRLNPMAGVFAQVLRGGEFTGLQGTVRIVVDDINNALIIQASSADYAYLLDTIKKMDVLPRQVIIDARIFEIDLTDAFSFGIAAALQPRGSEQRLTTGSLAGASSQLSASTFAFIGEAREILMALDTLRQKTKVRILEAPSVLALDGSEARITVGGEIPYPSLSYVGAAGGASTSVQYRDTGISLLVMPRVSASGHVTLNIAQEISAPGAPTPTGPTFNKTSVQTTLSVKDGQTVAIAGLIRDSNNISRNGIPLLSDIPLIGSLFGRSSRSANRTELLILITPHVIRTVERFQEITQELKDSLRNVRKLVDQKEREHLEDMEEARKDRAESEERRLKKPEKP